MDLLMKIYTVADGREKYGPTGAIFRQKCGRWYFEICHHSVQYIIIMSYNK